MNETNFATLPAAHVIEAAIVAFSNEFEIDDPRDVAERISTLMHGAIDSVTLHEMIERAGNNATDDVVQVLRMMMASACAEEPNGVVQRAVRSAGAKQLVITPELLYMAAAVVALLVLKPPKSSEHVRINMEESQDGRKKLTVDKKVTYLNPTSALVAVLDRVFRGNADNTNN